jgi:hypothetical protein
MDQHSSILCYSIASKEENKKEDERKEEMRSEKRKDENGEK